MYHSIHLSSSAYPRCTLHDMLKWIYVAVKSKLISACLECDCKRKYTIVHIVVIDIIVGRGYNYEQ